AGHRTGLTPIGGRGTGVAPGRLQGFWGDSDLLGAGRGNGGSGAIGVGGSAVLRATEKVIERGRRIAAHLLEAAVDDVKLTDGRFSVAGPQRAGALGAGARAPPLPPPPPPPPRPALTGRRA